MSKDERKVGTQRRRARNGAPDPQTGKASSAAETGDATADLPRMVQVALSPVQIYGLIVSSDQEGIVADIGGRLSGFLTWDRPDPRSALITWLAARAEERAATERALVETALEAFAAAGAELACVVVPGPSRADDAAPSQRPLYETLGFVALCEVPSLDEWTEVSVVLARTLTR